MLAWLSLIGAALQLALLIFQNQFEVRADEKTRKDKLHVLLADAIKRHDRDAVNDILGRLRT